MPLTKIILFYVHLGTQVPDKMFLAVQKSWTAFAILAMFNMKSQRRNRTKRTFRFDGRLYEFCDETIVESENKERGQEK